MAVITVKVLSSLNLNRPQSTFEMSSELERCPPLKMIIFLQYSPKGSIKLWFSI